MSSRTCLTGLNEHAFQDDGGAPHALVEGEHAIALHGRGYSVDRGLPCKRKAA